MARGMTAAAAAGDAAARRRGDLARGHIALLGFAASIAGSFSLGAMAANEIDPTALTALRFALAAAIMGAVAALGPGLRRAHLRAPWRWPLLGGLMAVYFVLMFEGLKTAPAISIAAVFTLTPLMTAAFGYLLLAQVTTRRMALALSVGAAGALWVIFRGDPAAALRLEVGRGEAVYFAGCIAHAAFTPLLKRLNRGEPGVVATFGFLAAGAVLLFAFGWREIAATDWARLPPIVWITLAYLAVMASALSFFLLQYGAMRLPSAKVMAYSYLIPSWVILWEVALGRGVPPAIALGGVALTLIALALLLKDEERPRA
jgi:drug/metabolite transporter (DMT)-like permease